MSAKLRIIYDPNAGTSYPDGKCEEAARAMCELRGKHVIGSSLLLDNIRLLVKQGVIPAEEVDICFMSFDNGHIAVDGQGHLSHWPRGFCDYLEGVLDKLLA